MPHAAGRLRGRRDSGVGGGPRCFVVEPSGLCCEWGVSVCKGVDPLSSLPFPSLFSPPSLELSPSINYHLNTKKKNEKKPPPTHTQTGFFGDYTRTAANDLPWVDESVELLRLGWSDILVDPNTLDFSAIDSALQRLAKNKKQAILSVYIQNSHVCVLPQSATPPPPPPPITTTTTLQDFNDTNRGKLPRFIDESHLKTCQDTVVHDDAQNPYRQHRRHFVVPSYEHARILDAIADTAAALGARYNGDARLFAVEVGFVGYGGRWTHGTPGRCPLPSKYAASRIVSAVAAAFSRTWVLMPRPWTAASARHLRYADHPNVGFLDPDFAGDGALGFPAAMRAAGLADAWRSRPVVALLSPSLHACWFAADPQAACEARGVTANVQPFGDALAERRPTLVHHGNLWGSSVAAEAAAAAAAAEDGLPAEQESARRARLAAAFKSVGAALHLRRVTLRLGADGTLAACAEVRNVGLTPFYPPPVRPVGGGGGGDAGADAAFGLEMVVSPALPRAMLVGDTPLRGLQPGEAAVFSAVAALGGDECAAPVSGAAVCAAAEAAGGGAQRCVDADAAAASRGDWRCECVGGAGGWARARGAFCVGGDSFRREPEGVFLRGDAEAVRIGTASELGVTGGSFTVAAWVRPAACFAGGCADGDAETTHWGATQTLLGSDGKNGGGGGLALELTKLRWSLRVPGGPLCTGGTNETVSTAAEAAAAETVNRWTHVASVYDADARTSTVYLDGEQVGGPCAGVPPLAPSVGQLRLGSGGAGARPLTGRVRDVRVFGGAALAPRLVRLLAARSAEPPAPQAAAAIRVAGAGGLRPLLFASEHGLLSTEDGVLRVPLPAPTGVNATEEDEGCLRGADGGGGEPASAVAAQLASCVAAVLSGDNSTVPAAGGGVVAAGCNGEYRHAGTHWVRADGRRELWPSPVAAAAPAAYRCTVGGAGVTGPRLSDPPASWWASRFPCVAALPPGVPLPTAAPRSALLPPLPAAFTPPTQAPPTMHPTAEPQTAAPRWAALTAAPGGVKAPAGPPQQEQEQPPAVLVWGSSGGGVSGGAVSALAFAIAALGLAGGYSWWRAAGRMKGSRARAALRDKELEEFSSGGCSGSSSCGDGGDGGGGGDAAEAGEGGGCGSEGGDGGVEDRGSWSDEHAADGRRDRGAPAGNGIDGDLILGDVSP